MKRNFLGFVCILVILALAGISWKPASRHKITAHFNKPFTAGEFLEKYISNIYESAHLQESGLEVEVFKKAITGYLNLRGKNKIPASSSILTVVDLAKSSHEKRMWIIDILNKTLVLNTWVAHGHGSGEDMATRFSDKMNSHKSSLGFYLTDDVYFGKNGRSLRLDGLDAGFNTNARARAIVVHGADYVGEGNIDEEGRLGRSYGCPAVSPDVADLVIDNIKDKTVMFINGISSNYSSKYLNLELAANFVYNDPANNYIANL
jgi:L,D-transpeptidase catalytic domain